MQCHLHLDPIHPAVISPTDSPHHLPLESHLSVWNGTNTLHPVARTLHVVMSTVAIAVFTTLALQTSIIKRSTALIKLRKHSMWSFMRIQVAVPLEPAVV